VNNPDTNIVEKEIPVGEASVAINGDFKDLYVANC
jgi:hypothetical protein